MRTLHLFASHAHRSELMKLTILKDQLNEAIQQVSKAFFPNNNSHS